MVHCKALALDPADRQICDGRAVKLVRPVLCLSHAAHWGVEEVDSMPSWAETSCSTGGQAVLGTAPGQHTC